MILKNIAYIWYTIYKYKYDMTKERRRKDGTIIATSRPKLKLTSSPTAAAKKMYKELHKYKQIK